MMFAKIGFHELRIHAPHGVWPEEKLTGNSFIVDLQVAVDLLDGPEPLTLSDTIDYVQLTELTRKHFSVHHELLENLALKIVNEIMLIWPAIRGCQLVIRKLDPLLVCTTADTFVELSTGCFAQ